MKVYTTIKEVQIALYNKEILLEDIAGFNCKQELFINNQDGETIFSAYYATNNACEDICSLLDIKLMIV